MSKTLQFIAATLVALNFYRKGSLSNRNEPKEPQRIFFLFFAYLCAISAHFAVRKE
jgi:hypothetical protein